MGFQYFPLSADERKIRARVWDSLLAKKPFGGLAVSLTSIPDYEESKKRVPLVEEIPLADVSAERNEEWDHDIRQQVHRGLVFAASRYQSDSYPAIGIPRSIYGQGQGLFEIYGCKLIPVPSEPGLYHVVPSIENASDVDKLQIQPLENSRFFNAFRFAKYAYESTEGQLPIKNPVMCSPIETANLALGSQRMMEWMYDEPEALHKFLGIATEKIISFINLFKRFVDGNNSPDIQSCLTGCFNLHSESRHMLSAEAYAEYEAPYLRRIGAACGPYGYHSCGTFERVMETDMQDPNLVIANFQTKEMDLKKVYDITKGRLSLSVGRSINLHERYLWPDEKSFYKHLLTVFPGPVPIETHVQDAEAFLQAYKETGGGALGERCGIRVTAG